MNNNQINPIPSDNINRSRLAEITKEARAALHNTLANPVSSSDVYEGQLGALPHSHPLSNQSYDLSKLGGITYNPDINIEDQLARQQGITESILKGLIGRFTTKTLGTAASSLATLFNIPDAIIQGFAAEDGKGFSTFLDNLYNGGAVSTIRELQESAEKKLEVYRSEAEQKAGLWSTEHIFSKKMFEELGDLFGFSTGAYLSGLTGSAIFGNGFVGGFLSTLSSTLGESGIEAYHTTSENLKDRYALLDNNKEQEAAKVDLSDLSPEDKLRAYGELNTKYSKLKEEAYNLSKDVGNMTFLANMAILGISNQIAFGKSWFQGRTNKAFSSINKQLAKLDDDFAKGLIDEATYKANKSLLVSDRELLSRSLNNSIGDDIRLSGNPLNPINSLRATSKLSKAKLYTGLVSGRLREGIEEMSQSWVSNASKDYYNDILGSLEQTNLSSRGEEGFLKAVNNYLNRGIQTLGDSSAWYEFTMGTLLGTTGTVAIQQNKEGKYRLTMAGNAITDYKEAIEHYNKVQELVDNANTYFDKPEFQNRIKYALSRYNRENEKNESIKSGDVNRYKALEEAGISEDISLFAQMGKINELKRIYESRIKLSDQDITELINSTTVTDENGKSSGRYVNADGSIMSVDEVREDIKNSVEGVLDAINTYTTRRSELDNLGFNLPEEVISHLSILEASKNISIRERARVINDSIISLNSYENFKEVRNKYKEILDNELNSVDPEVSENAKKELKEFENTSNILDELFSDFDENRDIYLNGSKKGKFDFYNWLDNKVKEYNNRILEDNKDNKDPKWKNKLISVDSVVNNLTVVSSIGNNKDAIESIQSKVESLSKELSNALASNDSIRITEIQEEFKELEKQKDDIILKGFSTAESLGRHNSLIAGIDKIQSNLLEVELKLAEEKNKQRRSSEEKSKRDKEIEENKKFENILKKPYKELIVALEKLDKEEKVRFSNFAKNDPKYSEALYNLSLVKAVIDLISNVSSGVTLLDSTIKDIRDIIKFLENEQDILNLKGVDKLEGLKKDELDSLIKLIESNKETLIREAKLKFANWQDLVPPVINSLDSKTGLTGNTPIPEFNVDDLFEGRTRNDSTSEEGDKDIKEILAEHHANILSALLNTEDNPNWHSAIPQFGLTEYKNNEGQTKYIEFPDSSNYRGGTNESYRTVYTILKDEGAFDFLNSGGLQSYKNKRGKLYFGIDPSAFGDNNEYARKTIFILIKDGDNYRKIGVLPSFSNKMKGFNEFREKLDNIAEESFNSSVFSDNSLNIFEYNGKPITTSINNIFSGDLVYGTHEIDLTSLKGLEEALKTKKAFIGIVKQGKVELPSYMRKGNATIKLHTPKGLVYSEGAAYLFIKGADGTFIPSYIKPLTSDNKEVEERLKVLFKERASALFSSKLKTNTSKNKAIGDFKESFYLGDNIGISIGRSTIGKLNLGITIKGKESKTNYFDLNNSEEFDKLWEILKENLPNNRVRTSLNLIVTSSNISKVEDALEYIKNTGNLFTSNLTSVEPTFAFFIFKGLDSEFKEIKDATSTTSKNKTKVEVPVLSQLDIKVEGIYKNVRHIFDAKTRTLYKIKEDSTEELIPINTKEAKTIVKSIIISKLYEEISQDPARRDKYIFADRYFIHINDNGKPVVSDIKNDFKVIPETETIAKLLLNQLNVDRTIDVNGAIRGTYTQLTDKGPLFHARSSTILGGVKGDMYGYKSGAGNNQSSLASGLLVDQVVRLVTQKRTKEEIKSELGVDTSAMSIGVFNKLYEDVSNYFSNLEKEGWIILGNNIIVNAEIGDNYVLQTVSFGDSQINITGIAGETDILLYNPKDKKYRVLDVKTSASAFNSSDLTNYNKYNRSKYDGQVYLYKALLHLRYGIPLDNIEVGGILPVVVGYTTKSGKKQSDKGAYLEDLKSLDYAYLRTGEAGPIITSSDSIGRDHINSVLAAIGLNINPEGRFIRVNRVVANNTPTNSNSTTTITPNTNNNAVSASPMTTPSSTSSEVSIPSTGNSGINLSGNILNKRIEYINFLKEILKDVAEFNKFYQGNGIGAAAKMSNMILNTSYNNNKSTFKGFIKAFLKEEYKPIIEDKIDEFVEEMRGILSNKPKEEVKTSTNEDNNEEVELEGDVDFGDIEDSTTDIHPVPTRVESRSAKPKGSNPNPKINQEEKSSEHPLPKRKTPTTENITSSTTPKTAAKGVRVASRTPNNKVPKPRLVNSYIGEVSNTTLQEELDWLDRVLPQISSEGRLKIKDSLIRVGDKGPLAWGLFKDGMVIISKMAAQGTVYHEAFHYVFNTILNYNERTSLLDELRSTNPKYNTYDDFQLEEELAEEFREYVELRRINKSKTLTEKIVQFFKNLFNLITNWNNIRPVASAIFKSIDSGKLARISNIAPYIRANKVLTTTQLDYIRRNIGEDVFYSYNRYIQDNIIHCRS